MAHTIKSSTFTLLIFQLLFPNVKIKQFTGLSLTVHIRKNNLKQREKIPKIELK